MVNNFIEQFCIDCHNQDAPETGLVLDPHDASQPDQTPAIWEKVVRKLRHRQMPPADTERPDEAAYRAVVASLEKLLDDVAAAHPNPGRTDTFRRLTRTEY